MAGPFNSSFSIHSIVLCDISNKTTDQITVYLDDGLLQILSTNNINVDDELDKIKNLATKYSFNLYICIIDHNEKKIDYFNTMFEQENSQWHDRAYLVYDKQNRTFYPFFKRDNNEKYYTIFQMDDRHTLSVFEDLVAETWPSYIFQGDTLILDEEENTPTINANHHTGLYNILFIYSKCR